MPTYPYDEKNAADYKEVTKRIDAAISVLECDDSIPATESSLAKLSGCSRGTLRNRVQPILRLKKIQLERKQENLRKAEEGRKSPLTTEAKLLGEARSLKEQLNNSRGEVAIWIDKYQEEKSKVVKSARANRLLKAENQALSEENENLKARVKKLEAITGGAPLDNVVVPFPKTKRVLGRRSLAATSLKKK